MNYFLGIDVGTGSARVGLFDEKGILVSTASQAITRFQPKQYFSQQSSTEIWQAICTSCEQVLKNTAVSKNDVAGIGIDATCSLVLTAKNDKSVSASPDQTQNQDIIMWLDHRAKGDAEFINQTGASQLLYVGGSISPEMQMPKLRWLQREMPKNWNSVVSFWDLPDWLVHKATGSMDRSMCSLVCKWAYAGEKGANGQGWDAEFLQQIGLESLVKDGHSKIGKNIKIAGEVAGYLTEKSAKELGLAANIPVSAGLIDAYAGAMGSLGALPAHSELTSRMAVIAGTSTCHIALSKNPAFVSGVWGPYKDVLLPDMWALEGGQSAAGALIDAVINRHGAKPQLQKMAIEKDQSIYECLEHILQGFSNDIPFITKQRHVQPDFLGNRAPLADPNRKGAISGLTLDINLEDLALDYLATIQALGYGTRHILEEMKKQRMPISTLVISGGLAKNSIFVRELCDITGCDIIIPYQQEPVLLGAAMMGAVAANKYKNLETAMNKMSGEGDLLQPRKADISIYHNKKYKVFRRMQEDFAAYESIMNDKEI